MNVKKREQMCDQEIQCTDEREKKKNNCVILFVDAYQTWKKRASKLRQGIEW